MARQPAVSRSPTCWHGCKPASPWVAGADLANVINEASLLAVRAGKPMVEQEELEEAIDRVLLGPARKSHLLSPEELWRIAVHESGHAIVAEAIDYPVALQKLSVVARGRGIRRNTPPRASAGR